MQKYKDINGKEWNLQVTYASVLRVRELVGVDLLKLDDVLFEKLGEPITLINVLYAMCKPQADAAGITDEQFGESLFGDPIEAASEALMGAVGDFFPTRKKSLLDKMASTGKRVIELQMDKMEAALNSPELESAILKAIPPSPELKTAPESPLTESSTKSPESSESTPTQERSAI